MCKKMCWHQFLKIGGLLRGKIQNTELEESVVAETRI